jgi:hypothetical protein
MHSHQLFSEQAIVAEHRKLSLELDANTRIAFPPPNAGEEQVKPRQETAAQESEKRGDSIEAPGSMDEWSWSDDDFSSII